MFPEMGLSVNCYDKEADYAGVKTICKFVPFIK